MNTYTWPANVVIVGNAVSLSFPDWPGLSAEGTSVQQAMFSATDVLSKAVLMRIEAKANIPEQSDLGPRQVPIAINAEVTAQLDGYLEERQAKLFQQTNEAQQVQHHRRAAFLAEFRAYLDPIEHTIERADAGAVEYASIGIRFCYILNAGGLVAVPAIMELLPNEEIAGSILFFPACAFVCGVVLAALTNFLAYRSMVLAGEGWLYESHARAKEVSGLYYPPEDSATHEGVIAQNRVNQEQKIELANICSNISIRTFGASVLAFLIGVGTAIFKLSAL